MSEISFESIFGAQAPATEKKEFELIQEGKYEAELESFDVDHVMDKKVTIRFSLTGETNYKNRKLWATYTYTDQGLKILNDELRKLGVSTNEIKSVDDLKKVGASLVGKKVEIFTKVKEFPKRDGTTGSRNQVYINHLINFAVNPVVAPPSLDTKDTFKF